MASSPRHHRQALDKRARALRCDGAGAGPQPAGPAGAEEKYSRFEALKLGVTLGSGSMEGTWDTLYLAFGDNETHTIASGPHAGFDAWQDIDLQATFGSPTVAMRDVGFFSLHSHAHDGIAADWWKTGGECPPRATLQTRPRAR